MFPTIVSIGPFRLATYGVLVAAGYLAAILWLGRERERMGLDEKTFWGLIYALFFGAVAGGKLLYWAVEWRSLLDGTLRPIAHFRFGFVFFGGVLGSLAAGRWYQRRKGFAFLPVADYFAVALPLGHAIGRLGCLAAGCCWGLPTELPWGLRFTHPESLVAPHLIGLPLHPVQLYESLADAAIAAALLRVLRRVQAGRLAPGTAAGGYLALYGACRIALELFRGDDRGGFLAGLSVSQWIGLAAVALGARLIARLRRAVPEPA